MKNGLVWTALIIGLVEIYYRREFYFRYRYTFSKNTSTHPRQKRQSGGGGIMIWGMVMPNGLVSIKVIWGKQNSEKYIAMLDSYIVPLMNLNMLPNYNFVQDNCTVHVSGIAKEYFAKQSFQVLEWPSKSPDINIMENVWKMISNIVYEKDQPKNIKVLQEKIVSAVFHINSEKLDVTQGLYHTFRQRLTRILVSKGNLC